MFKDAAKDTRATSTGLCRIITNYLFYLGMISKYEVENEQLIAGRIKYILNSATHIVRNKFKILSNNILTSILPCQKIHLT